MMTITRRSVVRSLAHTWLLLGFFTLFAHCWTNPVGWALVRRTSVGRNAREIGGLTPCKSHFYLLWWWQMAQFKCHTCRSLKVFVLFCSFNFLTFYLFNLCLNHQSFHCHISPLEILKIKSHVNSRFMPLLLAYLNNQERHIYQWSLGKASKDL